MKLRKMFDCKKVFLSACILFFVQVVSGVIIKIEVWSDGTNYRYLLHDIHVDYADQRNTIKQQSDIVWAIQTKYPEAFLIVEDGIDYTNTQSNILKALNCLSLKHDNTHLSDAPEPIVQASPLHALGTLCKNKGIPYYNVECGHGIECLGSKYFERIDIVNNLETRHEDISKLSTNLVIYRGIERLRREATELRDSVSDKEFIEWALKLRHALLCESTFYALGKYKSVKHGFICLGSTHIDEILPSLIYDNYRCIMSIGNIDQLKRDICFVKDGEVGRLHYNFGVKKALDVRVNFKEIFKAQNAHLPSNSLLPVENDSDEGKYNDHNLAASRPPLLLSSSSNTPQAIPSNSSSTDSNNNSNATNHPNNSNVLPQAPRVDDFHHGTPVLERMHSRGTIAISIVSIVYGILCVKKLYEWYTQLEAKN